MGYGRSRSRDDESSAHSSFNPRTLIDRRPKRSTKSALSHKMYAKPNKSSKSPRIAYFRKHLHVFDYMGKDAPKSFARSDRKIIVSGLMEPICANAFEHEVREEILAVIHQADVPAMNLSKCLSGDFEFIQVSAKSASVPTVREGFSWTGDAVKSLAGQGAVYV